MSYLIYISSAVKLMEDHELLSLLQQSREKNLGLGITGMLLYKGGNFMQMLEGEKQAVMKLFDTISKDYRHKDVVTIKAGDSKERNYEDWSMGFCNMDKAGDHPRYGDYIEKNLTLRSFHEDAHKAYRFMVLFNEINR